MRILALTITLIVSTMLHAQVRWCIVDTSFPDQPLTTMSNVAFLMTSDYHDQLCLVCKDGTVFAQLQGVSFRQLDVTGIRHTKADREPSLFADPVGKTLTIMGCQAGLPVQVFELSGHERLSQTTGEGKTTVDVSSLSAGIWLLKVGETTIKFLKR